jgi:hypothetical protein
LACRGEGKAVLQAHALQTLARLLTSHLEPSVFVLTGFREEPDFLKDQFSLRGARGREIVPDCVT